MAPTSIFLEPKQRTSPGDLGIILLARDTYQTITLEASDSAVNGYAEGAVLNTRFGSFPHSTFIDIPWGSQVRASNVDTGSRGRKRRRETTGDDTSTPSQETPNPDDDDDEVKNAPAAKAVTASSGFVHILRPSPELWTSSLPHRTQVVYTPDYSYILSRIRARPGTRIIEAGAGSGSFTHASVRAVYNGLPTNGEDNKGKVFSFEFNEARFHKMQEEITAHHLDDMVEIRHRDVYKSGFLADGRSPNATAVFLDLPAPQEAIRHLSRRRPAPKDGEDADAAWVSPLDPNKSVHICTFSPCIEQVMATVTELRKQGWIEVDMVEISNKRINVSRDKVGLNQPKEKGSNPTPADVMESVIRMKEVHKKTKDFHAQADPAAMEVDSSGAEQDKSQKPNGTWAVEDKAFMRGRIIHRPETDFKTHTSYLVFAILPPEWSQEEEAAAEAKWPLGQEKSTIGSIDKNQRRQMKRETHAPKKQKKRGTAESEELGAQS